MSWLTIFIIIILSMLVYWYYWRWKHRRMLQLAALVPGPPALPIIGNTHLFILNNGEQLLDKIAKLIAEYGEYCKFWLGPDLNICVKNPADIRLLLTSGKVNQKGPTYEMMKVYIGPGILTGGPTWRNHRKIATPSYNKKAIRHYSAIFNKEADQLAKMLQRKDPDVTFDVYFDVVNTTTQCVCQTLMGLPKGDSEDLVDLEKMVAETQRMYDLIFTKMTKWWLQIPLIYWLSGGKKEEDNFVLLIDKFVSDIISRRRRELNRTNHIEEEATGIVDRYILSGELCEQEIKWETFSLFTTSQEASAKIASAVLLILAHLPEWQEKVYNEIIDILGPDNSDVNAEEFKDLRYLDMVYKEALRYLSIAAFIQRTVEEETAINNGKLILPAGTSLIIPIHEVHRDSKYWEEPLKLKPERFLPENVNKRDPNAFIPFSLGAMDCLGRVFATALIKTIAVKVLRQVILEATGSIDDLKLHIAISVKFADGYNVRVRPRLRMN